MTPVFCCGFECGANNSGAALDTHWGTNTALTFSTSIVRPGSLRSSELTLVNTSSFPQPNGVLNFSSTIVVARCYVYFQILPNTTTTVFGTSVDRAGVWFKSSDNKLYPGYTGAVLGSQGISIVTNRWYRLDIKVNSTSNPWTIDVMVDGIPLTQLTRATGTVNHTQIGYGCDVSTTCTLNCDDIIVSNTAADYPIGPGVIKAFVPTADGTHNVAGANDFERTLTGTDIINSTTDAYLLVDDLPIKSSVGDFINMAAPPNATDYVEVVFGPAPGVSTPVTPPRAVQVMAGQHQAGTGLGNIEIRINDNGTTNTMYSATGVAGEVGQIRYKHKHYAVNIANGGPWTLASGAGNFNNLRARFGSPAALDVNPDQYFDGIMIEAEFEEPVRQDILSIQQAIPRASRW